MPRLELNEGEHEQDFERRVRRSASGHKANLTASIRHLGDLCLVYSASPTEVGQSQIIKNQDKINTAYNSMKARLIHFMELTKKEKEYDDARNEVQLAENEVKDALEKSNALLAKTRFCLLYTSPSPRDRQKSRMPSSA